MRRRTKRLALIHQYRDAHNDYIGWLRAALTYRVRGYMLWLLTDTQASLSSTMLRGWKSVLGAFLLSFLLLGVGLALWAFWLFCWRTEKIGLMWTYEGELVETKKSLLGSF